MPGGTLGGVSRLRRELIELVREQLGAHYRVEGEIGHGGASRVFRATRVEDRVQVALKVLRPELAVSLTAQRFLREIDVLRQLDHPNIARLLDAGESDWLVWYVMEFVEGPSLRAWLDAHGRAPLGVALRRACEILDAIAHAHERGIVHRDVKPENIVLSPGRGGVLLDFGIARAVAVSEGEKVTRSGFTVGTSRYMSPEQAAGQPVDHRSDLYALGCVLYESLTGSPPYEHELDSHVMVFHQRAPIPDIRRARPDVPKPLAQAMERALAKDPKDRWQSARELRAVLLAAIPP
jgi:serine/threonine-protein kinase